jgi:hypothetical protein
MKALTYIAGAAVAAIVALAATPGYAVPANGSFGFTFSLGEITLSPAGDISAATTSKTLPATLFVNTIVDPYLGQPNNLGLTGGETVTLNDYTIPITSGAVNVILSVGDIEFTFDQATQLSLIPTTGVGGSFSVSYTGAVSGGNFDTGTPAVFTESCTQSGPGAAINCSESVSVPPPTDGA